MDIDRGMPELDALYRDVVLDHFRSPHGRRPIAEPTGCSEGFNPLCGDQVKLCLKLEGGKVAGVEVQGRGCAISTASGSMLAQLLPGRTVEEARRLLEAFRGMMHGQAPPAGIDVGDLDALEGVKQFPVRVKCALLAWTTLEDLLKSLKGSSGKSGEGAVPAPSAAAAPAAAAPMAPAVTKEIVLKALESVVDPEIRLSVVDLGLVYGVEIDPSGRRIGVRMTLTTPACPYGPVLFEQAHAAIRAIPGVEEAEVKIVWEPPWDPKTMASDHGKDLLGIW